MTTADSSTANAPRHPPPHQFAAWFMLKPAYVTVLRERMRNLAIDYLDDDDLRDSAVAVLRLLRQREAARKTEQPAAGGM